MAQYYRLLGSCRRPGIERDSQFLPDLKNRDDSHHIIVCCRNQMYCVIVQADQIGKLSEDEIFSQLLYILSDAPCLPSAPPMIGLLTAEPRRVWAKDREVLLQSEQNSRNIELIEKSLINLCLDETLPPAFNARGFVGAAPSTHLTGDRDETNMAHEMIHGGGSECNTANRWFDKTMQIIICNDGTWGLCYEHSTSEGIAVVSLLEKILNKIDEIPSPEENGITQQHLPPPERLEWIVEAQIQRRIQDARRDVDR
jgi:choline O-acetyltransferase